MAERLAPERAPLRITSKPERPRRKRSRWGGRVVAALVALLVVTGLAVVLAHFLVVDRGARQVRASALIPEGLPANVLVVLARPGQEVPMAGTLRALDEAGARVSLLALTSGEAQPPDLQATTEGIGALRAQELAVAAEHLGVESAVAGNLPDGGLVTADPDVVRDRITSAIGAAAPSVILTVSDTTGTDTDAQTVAALVLEAARAPGSGVARVWAVTRGEREVDLLSRLADPVAEPGLLPDRTVSVPVPGHAVVRGEVLSAHGTRSPDLAAATYPYADRVPAWAYFRFLDHEYFHLAWGEPLP